MPKKQLTASEMGKKRWKGVSKKARSEHARAAGQAAQAGLTDEQKSENARRAVTARWKKAKKSSP